MRKSGEKKASGAAGESHRIGNPKADFAAVRHVVAVV